MPEKIEFKFQLKENLSKFSEGIKNEREERLKNAKENLSFGVPFLDDSLGGIYKNDLILFGAKTGIGKTQLATLVAKKNAGLNKRVHFFAQIEAALSAAKQRPMRHRCFSLRKEGKGHARVAPELLGHLRFPAMCAVALSVGGSHTSHTNRAPESEPDGQEMLRR